MSTVSRGWDSGDWDARYGGAELVWSAGPNQFLVAEVGGLAPGRAVDLACGEGRNALWLAERGWEVTGVDFSPVGLAKAAQLARAQGVEVTWVESDVLDWRPAADGFDLVLAFYLQLRPEQRADALRIATAAVGRGGTLLVVAHDMDNLAHGVGGPQDPSVLYQAGEVAEIALRGGLVVARAGQVSRDVPTEDGPRQAIDTLVRAYRPRR